MEKLFDILTERGYKQTSLSVEKENPALWLYQRMGYMIVRENGEDFIMARDLEALPDKQVPKEPTCLTDY